MDSSENNSLYVMFREVQGVYAFQKNIESLTMHINYKIKSLGKRTYLLCFRIL